ncbi:MAG TPA: DUF5655 domain-containing protein [Thermoplasmata archaeon]|jgi:hypothetical protein
MGTARRKTAVHPKPSRAASQLPPRSATKPPLWTCPRCGKKFVTRNIYHSCGPYTVADFLRGKGPKGRALFRRFESLLRACGPVTVAPNKTGIAFMVRVRFAGVRRVSDRGMTFAFALLRRIESPRIAKVEQYGKWYGHIVRVTEPGQLDDEVLRWLRESYRVGEQRHLYG